MNDKTKIILAVIGVITTIVGGGSFIAINTYNETNISDDDTTFIENIIEVNLGIDISEFKKLCDAGTIPDEFEQYCKLLT